MEDVLKILYRNITCFEKFAGRTAVIKKVGSTRVRKIGTRRSPRKKKNENKIMKDNHTVYRADLGCASYKFHFPNVFCCGWSCHATTR